jgi:tetratricopeptide (TPR) repeat protein
MISGRARASSSERGVTKERTAGDPEKGFEMETGRSGLLRSDPRDARGKDGRNGRDSRNRRSAGALRGLLLGALLLGAAGLLARGPASALAADLARQAGESLNGGGQEGGQEGDQDVRDEEFDELLKEIGEGEKEAAPETPPAPGREPRAPAPAPAEPPRAASPPRAAPRPAAAPPAGVAGEAPAAGTLFDRLGLSQEARREEAKELLRLAERARDEQNLQRAEGFLEEALRLDPENEEAERLLSWVQFQLGSHPGEVREIHRDVVAEERVRREQARVEVRRMLNDGIRYEESEDYARAIKRYELALETIRHFPFDLGVDSLEEEARGRLERAQEANKLKEEKERQEFLRMMNENRLADEETSLDLLQNRIRMLRRKAKDAEEQEDYDRAITYYKNILSLSPQDEEARRELAVAKVNRHRHTSLHLLQRSIETYETAIIGLEESSIVFQQIFRYPDYEEWLRISPKVVGVEEEIAARETAAEKEIKAILARKFDLGFEDAVPFKEALATLQQVSTINFVLTKEGGEALETQEVTIPRYRDLPLESYVRLLLEAAGEGYDYAIRSGAVVIGPADSLQKDDFLRFYEISDLVQIHPNFPAPDLALDELQGKSTSAAPLTLDLGDGEPTTGPLGSEKLLQLIHAELAEEEGGEAEGVAIHGGKLSARTTVEKHLKLVQLLEQFRKATGVMVTVESRFIDIQDNFLEEIGVALGNTGSNFLPNAIPDIDGAGTSIQPGIEYVNDQGDYNSRVASISNLSNNLGSQVNPFNLSAEGGGAYQLNVLELDNFILEAILTGVAKEEEIRRLASPRVTAYNGQISHTLVVNQSAYIQDLEVNQTGVIPVINPVIGVVNSGSILEVRPTISHDQKYVSLEVQPTLAELLDPDVALLSLAGNFTIVPVELPVLNVTKIKTTVTVPDGGTVLVGGLKREIAQKAQTGIPGLLDIPLINYLFGRRGQSKLRSNLFVLLNAKITIVHEEEKRLFGT